MKIMNVCSVALLAIGIWACSGQKKGTANVEVATDSVEVTADAKSVQADSTGYIVRGRWFESDKRLSRMNAVYHIR